MTMAKYIFKRNIKIFGPLKLKHSKYEDNCGSCQKLLERNDDLNSLPRKK